MYFTKKTNIILIGFLLSFCTNVQNTYALSCEDTKSLAGAFLKLHNSHHVFNDELSKRTLNMFIKSWDSGKTYFLKSDIDDFKKRFADKIDDKLKLSDCTAMDEIISRYSVRFAEVQHIIKKLISTKHDFTVDESLELDPKKQEWPLTKKERLERWRKRIKYQILSIKESFSKSKKKKKATKEQIAETLAKTRKKLTKRYNLQAKRHNEITSDDVYSAFLNAFSLALDPHSEYYTADTLESFRSRIRLSFEGIGAELRGEDGFTIIVRLLAGGAAIRTNKLKINDKIIKVAQGKATPVDVIDMSLTEVVKLIKGKRGTEVRLTILRESSEGKSTLVVPIIREKIKLSDASAKSYVYKIENKVPKTKQNKSSKEVLKIGVINLPSFYLDFAGRENRVKNYTSSSRDVNREITKLKKQNVDAIIVDLRSNGGGALPEAIDISGLFIKDGPVVQVKTVGQKKSIKNDLNPEIQYNGPLVVMINKYSASASEIFAGAIKDYKRGIIVGDSSSFGKGTVQIIQDLQENLGAIKVTVSQFYRPLGSSTQLEGVKADIVLPNILDAMDVGEKSYENAIPWGQVKDVKINILDKVTPYLKNISMRSKARVKNNKLFNKITDAVKKYKSKLNEKLKVSLKEETLKDKNKDKEDAEDDASNERIVGYEIDKDAALQESLLIAADYSIGLAKKNLGILKVLALKKPKDKMIVDKNQKIKKKK